MIAAALFGVFVFADSIIRGLTLSAQFTIARVRAAIGARRQEA